MNGPKIRRLYYSSREICDKFGISAAKLRQWLAAYPQIRPAKSRSGRLLFRADEIRTIRLIKKYTDWGLSDNKISDLLSNPLEAEKSLKSVPRLIGSIKKELEAILDIISRNGNDHS